MMRISNGLSISEEYGRIKPHFAEARLPSWDGIFKEQAMLSLRLERLGLDRLPGMNRLYLDLCARPELRARLLGDPRWDLAALRERAGMVGRPVRVLPELAR